MLTPGSGRLNARYYGKVGPKTVLWAGGVTTNELAARWPNAQKRKPIELDAFRYAAMTLRTSRIFCGW